MFRRIFVPALFSVTLIVLSFPIVFAQSVTPPPQPATGPGGKQYVHANVTKTGTAKAGRNTGSLSLTRPGRVRPP